MPVASRLPSTHSQSLPPSPRRITHDLKSSFPGLAGCPLLPPSFLVVSCLAFLALPPHLCFPSPAWSSRRHPRPLPPLHEGLACFLHPTPPHCSTSNSTSTPSSEKATYLPTYLGSHRRILRIDESFYCPATRRLATLTPFRWNSADRFLPPVGWRGDPQTRRHHPQVTAQTLPALGSRRLPDSSDLISSHIHASKPIQHCTIDAHAHARTYLDLRLHTWYTRVR
ncbi:hypothetical protein LX32DRAFT_289477 [Colletotrichum zoysiae]|uniref:Uncharacterized protein n=1 Tax=Colletotrichum zoysiae TaxID=1216348 RepID=A0AAD9H3G6_9PEZI|nr:hypothetical protein LX32DRAFT_289477 [Colletotrichum zoysiae]